MIWWRLTLITPLCIFALLFGSTVPAEAMTPQPFMPIRSAGSGLCVGVVGGSTATGAAVIQWSCSGAAGIFEQIIAAR